MSGHSKWHNIQARKGKQDAKRSNEFTKLAKQITIAAQKGADPAMNFSLRLAIEKAKAVSMPKDNIERAVKRGSGQDGGEQMSEAAYEAFGPGGAAILIKCLTDNKNRTLSEVKHILNVHGGSFAGVGSVAWMFVQVGIILVPVEQVPAKDEFELAMIDAGADDIHEDDHIEIRTKPEQFQKVLAKLKELGLEPSDSGIRYVAKDPIATPVDQEERLAALFEALEAHDDVEDFFTNAA